MFCVVSSCWFGAGWLCFFSSVFVSWLLLSAWVFCVSYSGLWPGSLLSVFLAFALVVLPGALPAGVCVVPLVSINSCSKK